MKSFFKHLPTSDKCGYHLSRVFVSHVRCHLYKMQMLLFKSSSYSPEHISSKLKVMEACALFSIRIASPGSESVLRTDLYFVFEVNGIMTIDHKRCFWIPDYNICVLPKLKCSLVNSSHITQRQPHMYPS